MARPLDELVVSAYMPRRRERAVGPPRELGGTDRRLALERGPHVSAVRRPNHDSPVVRSVLHGQLFRRQNIAGAISQRSHRYAQRARRETRVLAAPAYLELRSHGEQVDPSALVGVAQPLQ